MEVELAVTLGNGFTVTLVVVDAVQVPMVAVTV
jgi:hypothetical protein